MDEKTSANDFSYKERFSDEQCPDCGSFVKYGYIPSLKKEFQIGCQCMQERTKKERERIISAGTNVIRSKMRELSGMKTKQRGVSLYKITPRHGQQKAYNAAISFVERFSANYHTKGIILSGGVGSGKTFISSAIANTIIDRHPISEDEAERAGKCISTKSHSYTPVRFTSTVELFEILKSAYSNGNRGEIARDITEKLKNARLLVLDDVGTEKSSDWVGERLFEIIDHRYNEELPIIITTNATPKELRAKIGDRNYDRLREMCIYTPVTAESQRKTAGEEWGANNK